MFRIRTSNIFAFLDGTAWRQVFVLIFVTENRRKKHIYLNLVGKCAVLKWHCADKINLNRYDFRGTRNIRNRINIWPKWGKVATISFLNKWAQNMAKQTMKNELNTQNKNSFKNQHLWQMTHQSTKLVFSSKNTFQCTEANEIEKKTPHKNRWVNWMRQKAVSTEIWTY